LVQEEMTMTPIKCDGCDGFHAELEQVFACEAAQQADIRRQLDAEDARTPKRDQRFLSRNAPLRKGEAERCAKFNR
jgi:hypothetical protein